MSGDGCSMTCTAEMTTTLTAFRMTDLDLRDPHVFIRPLFGCNDATDTDVAGQPSVNARLQEAITMDTDMDGMLELSPLQIFRPLDQAAPSGAMDILFGECTDPEATTMCAPPAMPMPIMTTATNMAMACLGTLPGTTSGYMPGITLPAGPCYVSDAETLSFDLGGVPITLTDARIAGTYSGSPATRIINGLIRGFLSQADAETAMVDLGILGMRSVASLLPGGMGSCRPEYMDGSGMDNNGTTNGWYFYLNFTARVVPYTEM
jgi:hypothetical protein